MQFHALFSDRRPFIILYCFIIYEYSLYWDLQGDFIIQQQQWDTWSGAISRFGNNWFSTGVDWNGPPSDGFYAIYNINYYILLNDMHYISSGSDSDCSGFRFRQLSLLARELWSSTHHSYACTKPQHIIKEEGIFGSPDSSLSRLDLFWDPSDIHAPSTRK